VQLDEREPETINDPFQFSKEFRSLEPGSTHHVTVCAVFGTDDADEACAEADLKAAAAGTGVLEPGGPLPVPPFVASNSGLDWIDFEFGWRGTDAGHDFSFYEYRYTPQGGSTESDRHGDDGNWMYEKVENLQQGTKYAVSVRGCVSGIFGDPCSGWSPDKEITTLLPYGPDTCAQGFVWRDAVEGDHICVTPERRQEVADDNALASTRAAAKTPPGQRVEVGTECNPLFSRAGDPPPPGCNPLTGQRFCNEGFVGRAATPQDTVCVTQQEADLIAQENANPNANRARPN
jgi:hypothetical protein